MKAKFNIDITLTNDCGTNFHFRSSSSGCDYSSFLAKRFEFDLRSLELMNEELSVLFASSSL